MEIAVILLSTALALAIAITHSYKKERDIAEKKAEQFPELAEKVETARLDAEYHIRALEGNKLITEALRKDLEDNNGLIESMKELAINDRMALKSALHESDLSNAEARNLAKKVEILQKVLNEEQNMIIELENKIDSLKAKAKKAKTKKPVKKKKKG